MSIQSSINQMLSSIANQQLYKGLIKDIGNIKTEVGNVGTAVSKTNKAIQKQTKSQAAAAYKQNQALAALMTQNQRTPQLTPDNATETTKPEDSSHLSDTTVTDYVDKSIDPNDLQKVSEIIREHGSIQAVEDAADIGKQELEDEIKFREELREEYADIDEMSEKLFESFSSMAQARLYIQQNSARRTNENIAQRLQKAKAERSQAKQEFLKNKGGKHR